MFLFYLVVIWLLYMIISRGWLKKCLCRKKRSYSTNTSIIRPARTGSIRYSVPSSRVSVESPQSPPSYNSIVADNSSIASAPSSLDTSSNATLTLYPLLPVPAPEPSNRGQCLVDGKNHGSDEFICYHHDPINGCNGIFGQKVKKARR